MSMTVSVLAAVEASVLFADENINWKYCKERATFQHKEACEFILHIGGEPESGDDKSYAETILEEMKEYGCTLDFIAAYTEARDAGALHVLFYM